MFTRQDSDLATFRTIGRPEEYAAAAAAIQREVIQGFPGLHYSHVGPLMVQVSQGVSYYGFAAATSQEKLEEAIAFDVQHGWRIMGGEASRGSPMLGIAAAGVVLGGLLIVSRRKARR